MAMMTVEIRGSREFANRLHNVMRKTPGNVKKALLIEADIELQEAKRRTPVDTGALQRSGQVVPGRASTREVSVRITFGGESTPHYVGYAVAVHEGVDTVFNNGQAKFLESTIREAAPFFASRLLETLRRNDWLRG